MDLQEVQTRLQAMDLYHDKIDGDFGENTRDAITALFLNQKLPVTKFRPWPDKRKVVAAQQLLCRMRGIPPGDIDGLVGPDTLQAFRAYDARNAAGGKVTEEEVWRDSIPAETTPIIVPTNRITRNNWPKQKDMVKFFGNVGTNQTTVRFPYEMRLAWDKSSVVRSTQCHVKVRESIERILAKTLQHYSLSGVKNLGLDLFGGCLNVRKMRGGSAWSMHSWGTALDFDPERNQLKWNHTRAQFAKSDYLPWFSFWEEEDWVSLGRHSDFDWMHVQAAKP